jgi:hypothetical protein
LALYPFYLGILHLFGTTAKNMDRWKEANIKDVQLIMAKWPGILSEKTRKTNNW